MNDRELMQQALDALDDINQCSLPPTGIPLPAEIDHVMEALRARLAQPEPTSWEPKIWRQFDGSGKLQFQKIKRTPNSDWEDYYPMPSQREWQTLTDEEIKETWLSEWSGGIGFARAIEAKLKEKNS